MSSSAFLALPQSKITDLGSWQPLGYILCGRHSVNTCNNIFNGRSLSSISSNAPKHNSTFILPPRLCAIEDLTSLSISVEVPPAVLATAHIISNKFLSSRRLRIPLPIPLRNPTRFHDMGNTPRPPIFHSLSSPRYIQCDVSPSTLLPLLKTYPLSHHYSSSPQPSSAHALRFT